MTVYYHRKNYVLSLLLVLPLILLCACTASDEPVEPAGSDSGDIYLTLEVGVSDASDTRKNSRAPQYDYYFEEPLRQNERLNRLRVFITDENDVIEATRYVLYDTNGEIMGDNLTFHVSAGAKKIYLIGNEISLPSAVRGVFSDLTTGDAFPSERLSAVELTRSFDAQFFTTEQEIPMAETFDMRLDQPESDMPSYVTAKLFVTRIAVKYTFICADDVQSLTVRINPIATNQYFMPTAVIYDPPKYSPEDIINGISGRNITSFESPSDAGAQVYEKELLGKTKITLTDSEGKSRTAYRYDPIYLMETPGTSFEVSAAMDLDAQMGGAWFDPQTLPNLPLLPRNTHVVVNMSVIFGLHCTVDLVPYRGCVLEPWFGLERN